MGLALASGVDFDTMESLFWRYKKVEKNISNDDARTAFFHFFPSLIDERGEDIQRKWMEMEREIVVT